MPRIVDWRGPRAIAPMLLGLAVAMLLTALPWGAPTTSAGTLELKPSADAWANRDRRDSNYGSTTTLKASAGTAESFLRFTIPASWTGLPIGSLSLTVGGVQGNAAGLAVDQTVSGWTETGITWKKRPAVVAEVATAPVVTGSAARFDVADLFPSGVVDRSSIWIRIRNTNSHAVTLGSRESSTNKPRLALVTGTGVVGAGVRPIADTWVDSTAPSKASGNAKYLVVDGKAKAEAYLLFDLSAWLNQPYTKLELQLKVRNVGGTGLSVSRVSSGWTEASLNWKSRPTTATLLKAVTAAPRGNLKIDISSAFSGQKVSNTRLALRIVTTNARGFDFSSREGPTPPQLLIAVDPGPPPSPAPTAAPTSAPTAAPTSAPTAAPTAAPTTAPTAVATASPSSTATIFAPPTLPQTAAPPTAPPTDIASAMPPVCPTVPPTQVPTSPPTAPPTAQPTNTPAPTESVPPSPTTEPTPSPTPAPRFYFEGHGTDHGVGMSQWGAKGRAIAGQTYDQILMFYYTGVQFTTIDGSRPIRVLLGQNFWPTATLPARVTGSVGNWQSDAFPGMTFPAGSYVEMWPSFPEPPPTASPDPTPTPTQDLGCGPAPTSTPAPSTPPTAPPVPETWIATVYDSTGAVIASASTTDMWVEALDPNGILDMRYRDEDPKYNTYRGKLRLIGSASGLETINSLPLESYLLGVVPAEMPATWPLEAVKTQAVAARTYAWARLKTDREWDVVPTAANQVYGGYRHEEVRSNSAVQATANLVLTYNGKVISAVFHSASGGYTENSEYAFVNDRGDPGNRVAYLRGKPDVDENGVAYDINAGSYDWATATFTMAQLSAIFRHNNQTDVGDISNITYRRGVSGRVYCVILEGSKGTKQVSGGRFKNIFNDWRPPGLSVKSTMYYLIQVPP